MDRDKWLWAIVINVYHSTLIVGLSVCGWCMLEFLGCSARKCSATPADPTDRQLVGLAAIAGALGGTLVASRYVVQAVRMRNYDTSRIPWQLLTPLHAALLSGIGYFAIKGGVLSLAQSDIEPSPKYVYFVIGVSFLIGLTSESFLKRLIMAAEALFGERGDLLESPQSDGKNSAAKSSTKDQA